MRPDFGQIQRQSRQLAEHLGETATWKKYVSASAGRPEAGIGDEPCYVHVTITGLFVPVSFDEIAVAGGQLVAGDMRATLVDCLPSKQDEIVWSGVVYRIEADTIPTRGYSGWSTVLLRGAATG